MRVTVRIFIGALMFAATAVLYWSSASAERAALLDQALTAEARAEVMASADALPLTRGMLADFIAVGEAIARTPFSEAEVQAIAARELDDFQAEPQRVFEYMAHFQAAAGKLRTATDPNAIEQLTANLFTSFIQNHYTYIMTNNGKRKLPLDVHAYVALAENSSGAYNEHIKSLAERGDLQGIVLSHRPATTEELNASLVTIYEGALNRQVVMPTYRAAMAQTRQLFAESVGLVSQEMREHGELLACDGNPDCVSEYRFDYDSNGNLKQRLYVNESPVTPID